ncbi:hypothetical protein ACJIZ3_014362 [Penstemon smallii]|uniref:Yippee domain-containing protein n=1 Tax=Penstemon smallii TaxID=265156 RepID=A0ABD3RJG2_9LAMI
MGSPSSLITYDQDNNSRFYICLCKTSISLCRNMIWKCPKHVAVDFFIIVYQLIILIYHIIIVYITFVNCRVNVELFHSHLRIIGYDTTENVHCVKCGARLGYKVAKPSQFPTDDPIVLFWIDLTKVLEWNGNEILGLYAKKVEYDDDCAAAALADPLQQKLAERYFAFSREMLRFQDT